MTAGSLWQKLIVSLVAGSITGFLTLSYCISFAALIYSEDLSAYISVGLSAALISSTLMALVTAFGSSFRFALGSPDSTPAALVAVLASTISAQLASSSSMETHFSTVWMGITLSTILVGLALLALGQLRLGEWIRYIPYPVIGGFLAGTGWLLLRGAFVVMTGSPPTLETLFNPLNQLDLWLPGFGFGVILFAILSRFKQVALLPSLIVASVLLVHGGLWLNRLSVVDAAERGWLFQPMVDVQPLQIVRLVNFSAIDWSVLMQQGGIEASLILITAITILLHASALEVTSGEDGDLNRELKVAGLSNLVAGSGGGIVGSLSFSRSLLIHKLGVQGPLASITVALICGLSWLGGISSLLQYVPKLLLGGLLVYLGLRLLEEWVVQTWSKLSRYEYGLILITMLIIIFFGFLQGVGIGILFACFLFPVYFELYH